MATFQAKYHHLIPQTYMTSWANKSGTLKVEFLKEPGIVQERNKKNLACIKNYYSIKAGMACCTKQDTDNIFAPILKYNITLGGEKLTDSIEINKHWHEFDRFVITDDYGKLQSNKNLKAQIQKISIRDIEKNWGEKYERKWPEILSLVEDKVLNTKEKNIPAFEKDFLLHFMTALDWRSFLANKQFQGIFKTISSGYLDAVEIPENDRILPWLDTAYEEMRHELLLKFYRDYLDDKGVIYTNAIQSEKHLSISFLVTEDNIKFITSDTPVVTCKIEDKSQMMMPVTPNILMMLSRCDEEGDKNSYSIFHISSLNAYKYNQSVKNNALDFIIYG